MNKQVKKQLEKLSNETIIVDQEAELNGEKVKEIFCDHLPYAIKGHELALAAIQNPFAKLIINLAITILKAAGEKFCK